MKKITTTAVTLLLLATTSTAFAEHAFVDFDDDGNMVISGPFNAIIPKPEGARLGAAEHSNMRFEDEDLQISKAGYFADDQFVVVQIEQSNASEGSLTNQNLPVMELAGEEFRARTACIDISQEELDLDDDPLFEFTESQNVQIVPAVQAVQLFVTNDEGTAEGIILYMRNVAGGCSAVTEEFEAEFNAAFERFIESIRRSN